MSDSSPRWTFDEVAAIYRTPVLELIHRAGEVHRRHHDPSEVQVFGRVVTVMRRV